MIAALAGLLAVLPARQQAGPLAVTVVESAAVARHLVVPMSLPFARGALPAPPAVDGREPVLLAAVDDGTAVDEAPAVPLVRWDDGSIAVLQVHPRLHTAPGEHTVRAWAPRDAQGRARAATVAALHARVDEPLPLWTEVEDPWQRRYRAALVPDPSAGADGVLRDSGRVRVRRFRAVHVGEGGEHAGRPFLGLRAWLVTHDGERGAELTLMLDNQAPDGGPLGPVRLRRFSVHTSTAALRFLPAFAREHALPPPTPRADGGFDQDLLPAGDRHYLGDGTGLAFRLRLFQDGADVDEPTRQQAAAAAPCAFPDLDAVRASGAFGAHGGPAPRAADERDGTPELLTAWMFTARTGPWGGFGDPENSGAEGTPRNGPCALHNALRWHSAPLLQLAEAMVLQQSLRPTPGRAPALPAALAPWRQGLGPRAIAAPHGWTAPDYEHFSVLLLYDWWWLTGDCFARDELARLGRGLVDLLAALPFQTSRGEGWCLQSGVLVAKATGDAALFARLRRRVAEELLPELLRERNVAVRQPAHADVFDGREPFDAVWQMAALVHGLDAVQRATGDEAARAALLRTADVMAGPGWLDGKGPKSFVSALDPGRYTVVGDPDDRVVTATMAIGAFALAAEQAGDPTAQQRYRECLRFLLDRVLPPGTPPAARRTAAAGVWLQIALDREKR